MNLPLQYSSYSMVYDPTAFIACKLVVVAWLIGYGAATKPRPPVEQLPHGDAARHALVSRLLTKYLYQVTPPYCYCYKYSPWKYSGVQTGNPQRVDEIVFPQVHKRTLFWRKNVGHGLSLHETRMWLRKGKKKKSSREKLASGSRECLEKSTWMSSPKHCA